MIFKVIVLCDVDGFRPLGDLAREPFVEVVDGGPSMLGRQQFLGDTTGGREAKPPSAAGSFLFREP